MGFLKKLSQAFHKKVKAIDAADEDRVWLQANIKLMGHITRAHLVEHALNVGDKIPITELQTIFGESLQVADLLQKGPLVVKFHRGTWCDFCLADLDFYNQFHETLQGLGATAVAISTQLPEKTLETVRQNGYKFACVADTDAKISNQFGVALTYPEEVLQRYVKITGINFRPLYASQQLQCAIPSTYVIGKDGVVMYTFIDEDFRKRANVDEVVRFVKKANVDRIQYLKKCEEEKCRFRSFAKALSSTFTQRRCSLLFREREDAPSITSSAYEKDPLKYCLQDEEFLPSFQGYLDKTFCTENLLFYTQCSQYEDSFEATSQEDRAKEVARIVNTFVLPGSQLEINIDDLTRDNIISQFNKGDLEPSMFQQASKEIYRLMETDSFSKWRKTKEYSIVWKRRGSIEFLSPVASFAAEAA